MLSAALCLLMAVPSGRALFEARCAACHGADAAGGERGPGLVNRHPPLTRERLREVIVNGVPDGGMPPFRLSADELDALIGFLAPRPAPSSPTMTVKLRDGRTLRGIVRNESNWDLQLQALDGRLYLLDKRNVVEETRDSKSPMPPLEASPEEPPQPGDWPTYNGRPGGNRHSPLNQVHTGNVAQLAPRWIFTVPNTRRLEVTPVVVNGVMYVTGGNQALALDARTGRLIWRWSRPLTKGVIGDAAGGINRGVAVLGNRVFLVTDNAHLVALDRLTGALLWETEMADYREHYGATSAPLVAGGLVLSGTSGGDEGARGFVAAYKASTGERVWRFWLMPASGEPGSETWQGRAIEHGCVAGWLTGTYDPEAGLVYWPTGNPCPDYNGDERGGDNLYSDSVVALDAATGKLRWHFQFTPHDLHDWDAAQTPVLLDAQFGGRPRRLLAQANRNGFFYVLDRLTGEFLLGSPFVTRLTWAAGIAPDGRPRLLPGQEPTAAGTRTCPAVEGATNWMSTAYNPATGLFYVMALEACDIYTKSAAWWQPGRSFYGGATRRAPGEKREKVLRALDLRTGRIVWEVPQIGPADSWGGVLSTAGGLVFYGDDSGAFAAVDARTGRPLWHFQTSQPWKASPMTYLLDGRQYIAIAAGSNILAFALP